MSRTAHNSGRAGAPNCRSFPYGAPPCRISRPARPVTQAGGARQRPWVLAFVPAGRRWIEPLMGWTTTGDPFAQIRLSFPSLASAVDYAEREGLDYTVVEPPARQPVRRMENGTETAFWSDLEMWQPSSQQQNSTEMEVHT